MSWELPFAMPKTAYAPSLINLNCGWAGCGRMRANCATAESTRDSQSMKVSSAHLGTGSQIFIEGAVEVKNVSCSTSANK